MPNMRVAQKKEGAIKRICGVHRDSSQTSALENWPIGQINQMAMPH
jgi:hypothetical protein